MEKRTYICVLAASIGSVAIGSDSLEPNNFEIVSPVLLPQLATRSTQIDLSDAKDSAHRSVAAHSIAGLDLESPVSTWALGLAEEINAFDRTHIDHKFGSPSEPDHGDFLTSPPSNFRLGADGGSTINFESERVKTTAIPLPSAVSLGLFGVGAIAVRRRRA